MCPSVAVVGRKQFKFHLSRFIGDGIAKHDSVSAIPKGHRIKKALGILAGVLQLPVPASVGSVINAGLIAGPGRQQEGLIGGESHYTAKIEIPGAGNFFRRPDAAAVDRAQVGACVPEAHATWRETALTPRKLSVL